MQQHPEIMLRLARERQRLAIHVRQRSLVQASLILREVSRLRRPLPSEG